MLGTLAVGTAVGLVTLVQHALGASPADSPIGRGYYHRVWWWDEAAHSTAGLSLGLLATALLGAVNLATPTYILAAVFTTALVWEWYEVVAWDMRQDMGLRRWRHDTLADIAYVLLGTSLVVIFA